MYIYICIIGSSARSARALGPCGQGPCGPPKSPCHKACGSHGPLWAGPLGPGPCGRSWALVGQALVGPAGPLHDGLAPVAPTIGHSPRDDRRRHPNWIWLWLGQLHDDPRSVSTKGGIPEAHE